MSTIQDGYTEKEAFQRRVFASLTDSRRRHIVRLLEERSTPATERELAARVAEIETDSSPDSPETVSQRIHVQLHHVHLPELNDLGLVNWKEATSTVTLGDPSILDDSRVQQLLDRTDGDCDDLIACGGDERQRAVLDICRSWSGPVRRADLSREIATRNTDAQPSTEAIDDVCLQLHHHHLPKLDDAGLIEYDVHDETVTYTGPRA